MFDFDGGRLALASDVMDGASGVEIEFGDRQARVIGVVAGARLGHRLQQAHREHVRSRFASRRDTGAIGRRQLFVLASERRGGGQRHGDRNDQLHIRDFPISPAAMKPPSTANVWPVMKVASADTRKAIAAAISAGSA